MHRLLALIAALGSTAAVGACAQHHVAPESPITPAATEPPKDSVAEGKKLDSLLEAYFEESLAINPIRATMIGDPRYNYVVINFFSPSWKVATLAFEERWLNRLAKEIDRDALRGQALLSYDIFVAQRQRDIERHRFPAELQPITQFFSIPSFAAMMGSGRSVQPFRSTKDYDDWLVRMRGLPMVFDQAIINMREGIARGVTRPRAVMEKVLPQLSAHLVDDVAKSIFMAPTGAFPEGVSEADRERLTAAYAHTAEHVVIPAYRRLHDFIRDAYIPKARTTVGWWDLPDGAAWYAYQVKENTTTDMTPDAIHALGLSEVERIHGEMRGVMKQVGFEGELSDFFQHLRTDDKFYFKSEQEVLDTYRSLQERVKKLLPAHFDVFPKTDYEVRKIEAFRAKSSAAASYQPASADGSRPAVFWVNTHDLKVQPKWGVETLSIHEAAPGHHFQLSIQQEVETLPRFRRFGGYTAYTEGWGLYAESLGKELGLFTDPYQYYGHLEADLMRAMRLVVDTGMHHKRWTREKAIDYMKSNSAMAEADVVAEVERYIVWPGQALAYKIGQKRIRELRNTAEAALGERFDIKAFHRQILIDGALPLDVLSTKIEAWIAAQ